MSVVNVLGRIRSNLWEKNLVRSLKTLTPERVDKTTKKMIDWYERAMRRPKMPWDKWVAPKMAEMYVNRLRKWRYGLEFEHAVSEIVEKQALHPNEIDMAAIAEEVRKKIDEIEPRAAVQGGLIEDIEEARLHLVITKHSTRIKELLVNRGRLAFKLTDTEPRSKRS